MEKILEDALLKIAVVISDLFGASGRRFLDALVAGERSPAALAALGDTRLRATRRELEDALAGRFRDIHASGIKTHLRLTGAINEAIGQQLRSPARQTRDKIRDIERLNPGRKVILAGADPEAGAVA